MFRKMNIIQKIFNTYSKGLKYDALMNQFNDSLVVIANRDKESITILNEFSDLSVKYALLKRRYTELLDEGRLNILDLKDWYEAKYIDKPWYYDFDGTGKKNTRHALIITKKGDAILQKLAEEIITKYSLLNTMNPTQVVESVLKYFSLKKNWRYMLDKDLFKRNEFWQLAEISALTRKGDCDDLAILMHNVIYKMLETVGLSEHYWRLKMVAGTLVNYGGHAYNIWLHDDGEWYVVESTYDLSGSFNRTWLNTPIRENNLYRNFWGFVRKDKSWVGSMSALEPYKKRG